MSEDLLALTEIMKTYGLPVVVLVLAYRVWRVMRDLENEAKGWVAEANAEVTKKLDELRSSVDKMSDAIIKRMLSETEHAQRIARLEARANQGERVTERLSRDVAEIKGRLSNDRR